MTYQDLGLTRAQLKDIVWCTVAKTISMLGTCQRRQTGAVFLDEFGHVLATGITDRRKE
jgi:deoxycytidylate deaminase